LESFNENTFKNGTGQPIRFVQDNQSFSSKGVLRGLHYQTGEHAQAKLVRVLQGEVLDVVVDIDELGEEHGTFDHMSDEYEDEDLNYGSMKRKYYDIDNTMPTLPDFEDDLEEDILPEFMSKLNESLDMFNRFKKYN
jgi:hypothetical protein